MPGAKPGLTGCSAAGHKIGHLPDLSLGTKGKGHSQGTRGAMLLTTKFATYTMYAYGKKAQDKKQGQRGNAAEQNIGHLYELSLGTKGQRQKPVPTDATLSTTKSATYTS